MGFVEYQHSSKCMGTLPYFCHLYKRGITCVTSCLLSRRKKGFKSLRKELMLWFMRKALKKKESNCYIARIASHEKVYPFTLIDEYWVSAYSLMETRRISVVYAYLQTNHEQTLRTCHVQQICCCMGTSFRLTWHTDFFQYFVF